jgi:5-methylcytosine-specific restriction endonuclease McrA
MKPMSEFGVKRQRRDGISPWCKSCCVRHANAYYHANKEKVSLAAATRHRAHPEKKRESGVAYRAANKERLAAKDAEYRRKNKEKMRAYFHDYNERNREKISEKNRARQSVTTQRLRVQRAADPDRFRMYAHNRRARILANGGTFTAEEWQQLKAAYDHTCLRCGRREPDIHLTIDHVVPLTKGGTHEAANIQPLCFSCNARKRTRTVDYRPGVVMHADSGAI